MVDDPELYEQVWGEPPPSAISPAGTAHESKNTLPDAPPMELDREMASNTEPAAPDETSGEPETVLRWPQTWRRRQAMSLQHEEPEVPESEPETLTTQTLHEPTTTVVHTPTVVSAETGAQKDAQILRALDSIEERIAHGRLSDMASQSEARIVRALDMLETRLRQPGGSAVPDLVVLGRLDQVESNVSNEIKGLQQRLAEGFETGNIELRLKAEVSERLRLVAESLNDKLTSIQLEIHEKLDAHQNETLARLERLENRLRNRDLSIIEGLSRANQVEDDDLSTS